MKIINNPFSLQKYLKIQNKTIGFVPTMGALHEGHVSLIKNARAENEIIVVSIFVNPTQFLQGEDLDKYPSKDIADKKICELAGVDVLFFPNKSDIYTEDEVSVQAPLIGAYVLEGETRPGHFNGVLTVVMKLLNIVSPTRAYFGKKDAQQLNLITQMVAHMFMSVEIIAVETLRDSDGLALSSRNIYLSNREREEALKVSKSLYIALNLITQKRLDIKEIKEEMKNVLKPLPISYIEILTRDFKFIKKVEIGNSIVLVETLVGETRLLDNMWV